MGAEYTKERINERILERIENLSKLQIKDYSSMRFIDTSKENFQENAGLKQWAEIENLKIAASAYNKVNSITEPNKLKQYLGMEQNNKTEKNRKKEQSR